MRLPGSPLNLIHHAIKAHEFEHAIQNGLERNCGVRSGEMSRTGKLAFAYVETNLDPREYVRSQWAVGRYSLPEIRAAQLSIELTTIKSHLVWIYNNGKNRVDPDKPYLGLWNRIILKMDRAITEIELTFLHF